MSIQAVIFDMDGLLIDSESVGLTVMRDCAALQGVDLHVDAVRETLGATADAAAEFYHREYPAIHTDALFTAYRQEMHHLAHAGKIPLKKGALTLLKALQEHRIPCALASSSSMESIRVYLEALKLNDLFTVLMTGVSLPSKPAPDIFIRAAEALHVRPECCLVLEDSIHGVKAGRAAGMTVVMVPDQFPYKANLAPYVDYVLPDLAAAIPLISA